MLIEVTNFRINNDAATDNTVRITDPYPIFNWDFIATPRVTVSSSSIVVDDEINQQGFEIRLGTNPSNWGTNAFDGNIVETAFINTDARTWRYKDSNVARGNTYYGQRRYHI